MVARGQWTLSRRSCRVRHCIQLERPFTFQLFYIYLAGYHIRQLWKKSLDVHYNTNLVTFLFDKHKIYAIYDSKVC